MAIPTAHGVPTLLELNEMTERDFDREVARLERWANRYDYLGMKAAQRLREIDGIIAANGGVFELWP